MSAHINNNNEKEFNQIREESREGIEVARGTPYNSNAGSLAARDQGGEQPVVRSEDDGTSPVEGSSADGDDGASSSMESNDT